MVIITVIALVAGIIITIGNDDNEHYESNAIMSMIVTTTARFREVDGQFDKAAYYFVLNDDRTLISHIGIADFTRYPDYPHRLMTGTSYSAEITLSETEFNYILEALYAMLESPHTLLIDGCNGTITVWFNGEHFSTATLWPSRRHYQITEGIHAIFNTILNITPIAPYMTRIRG
jgi:hypothetical protein